MFVTRLGWNKDQKLLSRHPHDIRCETNLFDVTIHCPSSSLRLLTSVSEEIKLLNRGFNFRKKNNLPGV